VSADAATAAPQALPDADLERRFGALRRLYGDAAYARLRAARVGVVGLGGVGSWTVEALARSGVATLVLFDLDHVAESNVNRQIQALGSTLGQTKVQALAARVADIHPGCRVVGVEEFVGDDNWPALLPEPVDVLVDACDQVRAKVALARWAHRAGVPLVCVGAAGGRIEPQRVEVADLAEVTHDALLASLRQRLRQALRQEGDDCPPDRGTRRAARGAAPSRAKGPAPLGVRCVFSREPVDAPADAARGAGLHCHGYGSSVTVTATFGLVAAAEAIALLTAAASAAATATVP
jgi:tRNA A37 threonylcarbamoyladenosine dehydratase